MKIFQYTLFILLGIHLSFVNLLAEEDAIQVLPNLNGHYFIAEIPEFKGNPAKGVVFNNPEFYLHGFHLDYTKLKPMFEHGLLSVKELEQRGLIVSITHGGVTDDNKITGMCNGRNQISLSSVRLMNDQPPCYAIENAMTLVIQGVSLHDHAAGECSMGPQEVRVDDILPPQYFVGLIIPLNVLNQTIDKIDFMTGYDINTVDGMVIRELLAAKIKHLQEGFSIEDSELTYILSILKDDRFSVSMKGFEVMNKRINAAICKGFAQKFNRQQRLITFWDVIKQLIPENFPIYNENGDLIEDIWQKEGYELLVPEITLPEGW